MEITPYVMGSGRAAQALIEALRVIETAHADIRISSIHRCKRGEALENVGRETNPILIVANPHAWHCKSILAGVEAGFPLIVTEKPSCVSLEQLSELKKVLGKANIAVCHGYRQMWGIQTLKQMISSGEMGKVISIEGKYWQSSTAQKALERKPTASWKNDPSISGPSDVLLDIGVHWLDAATYLANAEIGKMSLWMSFENAESSHRDSHVHLQVGFKNGIQGIASISKTVHGASNYFEINVVGSQASATWRFSDPDQIEVGHGSIRSLIPRTKPTDGSQHTPFHGLGWLEGYVEVLHRSIMTTFGKETNMSYPSLEENLKMMEPLLTTHNAYRSKASSK